MDDQRSGDLSQAATERPPACIDQDIWAEEAR
jgi:hypothetical protein